MLRGDGKRATASHPCTAHRGGSSHGADMKFLFSRSGRMGAPTRLQPARGRGQPDRYANVDAPEKKQKLSRAEQRRCSAQPPPPHRVLIPVRAVTAHRAHAGTVAMPPCQSAQLGGRATILGTLAIGYYQMGGTKFAS